MAFSTASTAFTLSAATCCNGQQSTDALLVWHCCSRTCASYFLFQHGGRCHRAPDQSLSIHNMAVMFLDFLVMFKLIHCLEKAFGLRGPVESSSCKGRICLLHPWPRPGFQGWQLRDSKMTEFHGMFFFFRTTTKNLCLPLCHRSCFGIWLKWRMPYTVLLKERRAARLRCKSVSGERRGGFQSNGHCKQN